MPQKNDNFILENLNNITKLLLFQIEIGNLCRFECVIIIFFISVMSQEQKI